MRVRRCDTDSRAVTPAVGSERPALLLLLLRAVAVIHLERQQAQRRGAKPPGILAHPRIGWIGHGLPTASIRRCANLQSDEPIGNTPRTHAVGFLLTFVPRLPLLAA